MSLVTRIIVSLATTMGVIATVIVVCRIGSWIVDKIGMDNFFLAFLFLLVFFAVFTFTSLFKEPPQI